MDITFKACEASEALEERILAYTAKLEQVYDRITRCEVVVETPHRHHQRGRRYRVRIRLTVPGGEIITSHPHTWDDPYLAIHEAFLVARRQLEDHARQLRHEHRAPARRVAG